MVSGPSRSQLLDFTSRNLVSRSGSFRSFANLDRKEWDSPQHTGQRPPKSNDGAALKDATEPPDLLISNASGLDTGHAVLRRDYAFAGG